MCPAFYSVFFTEIPFWNYSRELLSSFFSNFLISFNRDFFRTHSFSLLCLKWHLGVRTRFSYIYNIYIMALFLRKIFWESSSSSFWDYSYFFLVFPGLPSGFFFRSWFWIPFRYFRYQISQWDPPRFLLEQISCSSFFFKLGLCFYYLTLCNENVNEKKVDQSSESHQNLQKKTFGDFACAVRTKEYTSSTLKNRMQLRAFVLFESASS